MSETYALAPDPQGAFEFDVQGISCLDCAGKFERSVAALPGVTDAQLNTGTGRLKVFGQVTLEAIRREGRKENYVITPLTADEPVVRAESQPWHRSREAIQVALSGLVLLFGYGAEQVEILPWLAPTLFAITALLGGWNNFKKAYYSLLDRSFNMAVLMAVAIVGAGLIGAWEEGAMVAFLFAVSEMLEEWTQARARASIRKLLDVAPKLTRRRLPDGREEEVPVDIVGVGDLILIRPGEKVALDGVIVKGESALNQAPITGESMPVEKGPGAEVWAGTLNTSGVLEVQVTKRVADTALARIIGMVEEAQGRRAPAQAFVERFAARYTPIVLILAGLIMVVPPLLFGQEWGPWIYRALSLLVVACPCALVLSTPVSIVAGIANAARNGVLIKGGVYLEELGRLQAIAFDKTGTLTQGQPALTDLVLVGESGPTAEEEALALAAAIEVHSEHPLARAIVRAAEQRSIPVQPAEGVGALVGKGISGQVGGERVYVGSDRLFAELGIDLSPVEALLTRLRSEGKTLLLLGTAQRLVAVLAVADQARPETRQALQELQGAGITRTIMLTGDNVTTARAIGERLGVTDVRAELLPDQKAAAVTALLQEHGRVAMVGDGINDAPALATATVGVAMGGAGSDTALETADVVLMADDLLKLPFAIRLSRRTLRVIAQNVIFSLAIKLVAILLVFPGWLTLWMAVLADTGATVIVTLNGMRLLRGEGR